MGAGLQSLSAHCNALMSRLCALLAPAHCRDAPKVWPDAPIRKLHGVALKCRVLLRAKWPSVCSATASTLSVCRRAAR